MIFDLANPSQPMQAFGPDLLLMGGAMVLMLWAAWRPESEQHQRTIGLASLGLIAVTIALTLWYAGSGLSSTRGVIAVDNFRWATDLICLLGAAGAIALGIEYNAREKILPAEAHVLVLFATAGMMVLAAARDLMIVFLGIELMSLAIYVLAGLNRVNAITDTLPRQSCCTRAFGDAGGPGAHRNEFVDAQVGNRLADAEVREFAERPQLRHVAEHRDAPA